MDYFSKMGRLKKCRILTTIVVVVAVLVGIMLYRYYHPPYGPLYGMNGDEVKEIVLCWGEDVIVPLSEEEMVDLLPLLRQMKPYEWEGKDPLAEEAFEEMLKEDRYIRMFEIKLTNFRKYTMGHGNGMFYVDDILYYPQDIDEAGVQQEVYTMYYHLLDEYCDLPGLR